ncbi:MAG: CBS domain-containing protein [Actinomycetota bacterium]|jgi:CBS domain-containing protein
MTAVGEIMTKDLITVGSGATVAEAATVMGERKVGSALVIDEGELVGIFTERDIVRALSQDFDAPGHPITHWMTRDPTTISPETTVQEALDMMLMRGFRHLPVVDGSTPVGMVSMRDLSRATAER